MTFEPNFPEHDIERLSAYIDGMLSDVERAQLEAQLKTDSALSGELEAMRQTIALIKGLPTLKAPRSFALTPEMAKKTAPKIIEMPLVQPRTQRNNTFFLLQAMAAAFVVFFGVMFVLTSQGTSIGNILSDIQPALSNTTSQESPVSGEVALLPTFTPIPTEQPTENRAFASPTEIIPSFIPQPLEDTNVMPSGGFGGGGTGEARPQGGGAGPGLDDFGNMTEPETSDDQEGIFTEEDLQTMENSETSTSTEALILVPPAVPEDSDVATFSMSAAGNTDLAQTEAEMPEGTPALETMTEMQPSVAQAVTLEPTAAKSPINEETNVARQQFDEDVTPEVTDVPALPAEPSPDDGNRVSTEQTALSPMLMVSVVGFVIALVVFVYLLRKRT